jgi:hypothetical protein
MSPRPSRSNLLDVLPEFSEFSEEEESTGLQIRPLLSMPPFPPFPPANDLIISSAVAALVVESEVEDSMEEISDGGEGPEGVGVDVEPRPTDERFVAQASLPPAPAPARAPNPSTARKLAPFVALVPMAIAVTALGFVVGFGLTDPPRPDASASVSAEPAPPAFEAPNASMLGGAPAAAPAPAPAVVATVAPPAAKPPPSLADGDWSLRHGQLARAEAIYQSCLARGVADHEALTGLGRVAAARHQTNDALAFFERALALQPEYFPARLGIADALWDGGRGDAAKVKYLEVRSRYSPGMVPARVLERTR